MRHTQNIFPNAILFHQQLSHGLLSDVPKRWSRQQLARRHADLLSLIAFQYQDEWLATEREMIAVGSDQFWGACMVRC